MNKKLLKEILKQHGEKQNDLARHLGISVQTLSAKMGGKRASFTQAEIKNIRTLYDLSDDDLIAIFFD